MIRLLAPVLLFVLLLTATGGAQAGERLLVPSLRGWVPVTSHAGPAGEVTELAPASETADDWTRRITIQAYRGSPATITGFLDMLAANVAAICEPARADPPILGKLGNLEAGSRFLACGRAKADGTGQYALAYAIRGREAFYVVIREWRGPAYEPGMAPVSSAELNDWLDFMRAVSVCDSTDPTRPCP